MRATGPSTMHRAARPRRMTPTIAILAAMAFAGGAMPGADTVEDPAVAPPPVELPDLPDVPRWDAGDRLATAGATSAEASSPAGAAAAGSGGSGSSGNDGDASATGGSPDPGTARRDHGDGEGLRAHDHDERDRLRHELKEAKEAKRATAEARQDVARHQQDERERGLLREARGHGHDGAAKDEVDAHGKVHGALDH
jgi:hypothetical protein